MRIGDTCKFGSISAMPTGEAVPGTSAIWAIGSLSWLPSSWKLQASFLYISLYFCFMCAQISENKYLFSFNSFILNLSRYYVVLTSTTYLVSIK